MAADTDDVVGEYGVLLGNVSLGHLLIAVVPMGSPGNKKTGENAY